MSATTTYPLNFLSKVFTEHLNIDEAFFTKIKAADIQVIKVYGGFRFQMNGVTVVNLSCPVATFSALQNGTLSSASREDLRAEVLAALTSLVALIDLPTSGTLSEGQAKPSLAATAPEAGSVTLDSGSFSMEIISATEVIKEVIKSPNPVDIKFGPNLEVFDCIKGTTASSIYVVAMVTAYGVVAVRSKNGSVALRFGDGFKGVKGLKHFKVKDHGKYSSVHLQISDKSTFICTMGALVATIGYAHIKRVANFEDLWECGA